MKNGPAVLGGTPASEDLIPVSSPTLRAYEDLAGGFRDIVTSGMITTAKYVAEFEREVAAYLGVGEAVAVSSNTTGLLLLLKSLRLRGDVILPSFTFSVSGHVLTWNNLRPVFVDIDAETCLMDPAAVEKAITPATCAILGVHIWGNPCPADRLQEIADRRRVVLLFDSAQGMGSQYGGRRVGGFGRAEVFSCSPTKLLTCGEGGVVTTNDPELARLVRFGRNYGNDGSYDCLYEGLNARMSEFHGWLGLTSLRMLDENLEQRRRLVKHYMGRLESLPGIRFQRITPGGESNWVYFSILVDPDAFGLTADELMAAMKAENIQTRRYYSPPLHRQRVYVDSARLYEGRLPNTERVASRALTLPLFSHMTTAQVDAVCLAVERIHDRRGAVREALARPAVTA